MSNGVIEAMNRRIQEGARAYLSQAGLPACFWPYAVQHWCILRNTCRRGEATTSYERQHGLPFPAERLPIGMGVFYYPTNTKYKHMSECEARLSYGILLGYVVDPGTAWSGLYMVCDLNDFINIPLHEMTDPKHFNKCRRPHYTKVIQLDPEGFRFPLWKRYQQANFTLEGREAHKQGLLPDPADLSDFEWEMKPECNRVIRAMLKKEKPSLTETEIQSKLHDTTNGPPRFATGTQTNVHHDPSADVREETPLPPPLPPPLQAPVDNEGDAAHVNAVDEKYEADDLDENRLVIDDDTGPTPSKLLRGDSKNLGGLEGTVSKMDGAKVSEEVSMDDDQPKIDDVHKSTDPVGLTDPHAGDTLEPKTAPPKIFHGLDSRGREFQVDQFGKKIGGGRTPKHGLRKPGWWGDTGADQYQWTRIVKNYLMQDEVEQQRLKDYYNGPLPGIATSAAAICKYLDSQWTTCTNVSRAAPATPPSISGDNDDHWDQINKTWGDFIKSAEDPYVKLDECTEAPVSDDLLDYHDGSSDPSSEGEHEMQEHVALSQDSMPSGDHCVRRNVHNEERDDFLDVPCLVVESDSGNEERPKVSTLPKGSPIFTDVDTGESSSYAPAMPSRNNDARSHRPRNLTKKRRRHKVTYRAAPSATCPEGHPKMPVMRTHGKEPHRSKLDASLQFLNACVARPVTKKEYKGNQEAEDAESAEWARLIDRGVWSYAKVRNWSSIASEARCTGKVVHLGRVFGIMVEKGAELEKGDKRRKFKYRVVFQGNNVVDQNWETAIFQDLGSSPASMEASKMADAYSCLPGNALEQADADQAYVQALLEGEDTWVQLPEECLNIHRDDPKLRPLFWNADGTLKYDRPCVQLIRALYGHPDAGSCWERHCDRHMKAKGFEPVPNWNSCYFHGKLELYLMIYVDDFKLAGPKQNLAEGWRLIKDVVDMGTPDPPGLFLGCIHEPFELTLSDGTNLRGMRYNMSSYLRDTVQQYKDLVKRVTGKEPILKHAEHPFLPEDHKEAPSGMPCDEFPAAKCPYCDCLSPVWDEHVKKSTCSKHDVDEIGQGKLPFGSPVYTSADAVPKVKSADIAAKALRKAQEYASQVNGSANPETEVDDSKSYSKSLDDKLTEATLKDIAEKKKPTVKGKKDPSSMHWLPNATSRLAGVAASILMRVLYAARHARFDLHRITCKLATCIAKWSDLDDKRLWWLMCYIDTSVGYVQTGFIGDNPDDLSLSTFADADFAGDAISQRSTSGVHLSLNGPRSYFPIQGASKKQTAVAFSTPEAELVSLCYAYKNVTLPALDLWEVLCPSCRPPLFHEDNQAAIMVVNSGRNPTMRHLGRVHRVSIQWLHERMGTHPNRDLTVLFYENTHNMSADIYTKSFNNPHSWYHALRLINVFKREDLEKEPLLEWMLLRETLGNDPNSLVKTKWSKTGAKMDRQQAKRTNEQHAAPSESTYVAQTFAFPKPSNRSYGKAVRLCEMFHSRPCTPHVRVPHVAAAPSPELTRFRNHLLSTCGHVDYIIEQLPEPSPPPY